MPKLAGYTLTRRLGVGGMGEVWMGRREALGGAARDVAIKLLSPERGSSEEARRMFLDEARLSMLLHNSNIVQVQDVAETEDKICYMVMEFVEGLDVAVLSEKLRAAGEVMPDSICAYIIGEVLKGLSYAHDLRSGGERRVIIHRDISPHNVMVSVSGEVKIMDFGIARVASEDTSGVHVKGKLRYMPPEQLRGETRQPTLDLFAVGAMLHELLDGAKFRAKVVDEGHLFGMIIDGAVPPMLRAPGTIPKELDELRRGLLAPKQAERIPSARHAFRLLSTWPGYRDTRFELDELVRRYLGEQDHGHGAAAPITTVLAPPDAIDAAPKTAVLAPPPALEVASSPTDPISALPGPEGSDTEISRVHAKAPRSRVTRVVAASFGLTGLGLAIFSTAAMIKQGNTGADEAGPRDATALALPEPKPIAEPVLEQAPVFEAAEAEPEPEPVEDPVPTEPVIAAQPERPAPATTKVTLTLASGIPWAEVKIGSRTFELDGFAGKGASIRLEPGGYDVAYRRELGAPWTKAGRHSIPPSEATLRLEKSGRIKVE